MELDTLGAIKNKLRYSFFKNELHDEKTLAIYIEPFGKKNIRNTEEQPLAMTDYVISFLNVPKQQSLLVLGDSGVGKTLLSLSIAKQMWESSTEKNSYTDVLKETPIPLYIHLLTMANRQGELPNLLLEQRLESSGLNQEERQYLKNEKIPLLLILDGLDEIRFPGNVYRQQQWHQWQIKTIYTCRPEALVMYQNYQQHFYTASKNEFFTTEV